MKYIKLFETIKSKEEIFDEAVLNGDFETVRTMIKNGDIHPSRNNNAALVWASHYGDIETVKLLLNDNRVDPSTEQGEHLRVAYGSKHYEIVFLLLNHPKIYDKLSKEEIEKYSMGKELSINAFKKLNENENKKYGYHITRRSNLEKIMEEGLIPSVPKDYGEDGDIKGVYLFKTLEDVENAMGSWLGEIIDEWEEEHDEEYNEVLLKVDISNIHYLDIIDSVEYEWTVRTKINPDKIELTEVDFI